MKKTCFKCGKTLAITSFYKHSQMKDGHLNKCKECTKKDTRNNYRSNIEHYAAYDKKRNKQPKRKLQQRKYTINARRQYPEKYRARTAVTHAVNDKRLSKPEKCSICGEKKKLEGHHEDYSKPLDVIWVCIACHRKVFHSEEG